MRVILLFIIGLASVSATPVSGRIVGGSTVSIDHYPMAAAMLFSRGGVTDFVQTCGGSIITSRTILSASHCYRGFPAVRWRARVGSTYAHSGGIVHNTARIYHHPDFQSLIIDNNVAVLHMAVHFTFTNTVQQGALAGANYNLADNQVVWAIGWGHTSFGGQPSEELQHVQVWTINQETCRQRYALVSRPITDSSLCSGWLNVGGRDQCQGDSGSPLLHNDVIVGVSSFGVDCGSPVFPGVNARVSRLIDWIVERA
ncbi:trypsin, alkaline B-like [Bicyclus anynana]|uniref:Trypsin, alkaline B-like n=1 Tax=Bicyclus anynana TaxID=110368 RepID=A0ABM3LIX2_BICAN|nr:trypsin, alkaline B-like [Bicyclus anynana]